MVLPQSCCRIMSLVTIDKGLDNLKNIWFPFLPISFNHSYLYNTPQVPRYLMQFSWTRAHRQVTTSLDVQCTSNLWYICFVNQNPRTETRLEYSNVEPFVLKFKLYDKVIFNLSHRLQAYNYIATLTCFCFSSKTRNYIML